MIYNLDLIDKYIGLGDSIVKGDTFEFYSLSNSNTKILTFWHFKVGDLWGIKNNYPYERDLKILTSLLSTIRGRELRVVKSI